MGPTLLNDDESSESLTLLVNRFEIAVAFLIAVAVVVLIRLVRKPLSVEPGLVVPPDFAAFQYRYLATYWLCTFSDWLKGPYVYALYEYYGFSSRQITVLFVGGFVSSLFFGTVVGSWSDRLGRKFMCLVFCGVYALSALTKPINSFWALFAGRLMSGVATSLLFTAFESWMVSEHKHRGYSEQLLTNTFSKATLGNGIAAIFAGLVAQSAATCCGYAAPFLVAVPCLAVAALLILPWRENYGNTDTKALESLRDGWAAMRREPSLIALGACESLFETTIYVWVFYWTPAIATARAADGSSLVPLGLLFSGYMAAFMIGGGIPDMVSNVARLALPLHVTAVIAFLLSYLVFEYKVPLFLCFALFEGCVGLYFPAHGTLRSIHIPDATRASVMNLFRFPMNAMVILILQLQLDTHSVMMLLCLAQAAALGCYHWFVSCIATKAPERV